MIVGVINIVLKDVEEGGKVVINYGEYLEGDGEMVIVDFNKGFVLGDEGYFNIIINYCDCVLINCVGFYGFC